MQEQPIRVNPNENLMTPFDAGKDSCGVGFVANMKNKKSHEIVEQGIEILYNLSHRGACGCETNTGDGAGILLQIPDKFFRKNASSFNVTLPAEGDYGVGAIFLPKDHEQIKACEDMLVKIVQEEGQTLLGWRVTPTDNTEIGLTARASEPIMKHVFIGKSKNIKDQDAFERKLFLIRKRIENQVAASPLSEKSLFYIASLSCRTIVYKGMLTPGQVNSYFRDLRDKDTESALALVHSRFSTNTFPSWDLAHPFRYIAHNGEINTLRGNINWMHARQALFETDYFSKEEIQKMLPIIREGQSDSASFDNALEILVMTGRSLPHSMMMMVPEAWTGHATMPQYKKDFYHYHSCLMEPWDGPASIAFTDGRMIGALLDRNGLRPSRYYVTSDDLVVMASEVGVLDIEGQRVVKKGRLEPGKMFLIDMVQGRIVDDAEIKEKIAKENPYGDWLKDNLTALDHLPEAPHVPEPDHETVLKRQKAYGYTHEDLRILMAPMATNGEEAIGSMGDDTPIGILSNFNQPLFNYFKQLFAQVTNPPLDAIREELVTSVNTTVGPEGNLLKPKPESCRQIELKSPVLDNDELAKFTHISHKGFKAITIPILYKVAEGGKGLAKAVDEICSKASQAVKDGYQIIILSDRGLNHDFAPIPSLLATAGVHHHLIRQGERTKTGLIIESGEPREVHHFGLLLGYGANAINPYLAFESLDDMIRRKVLPEDIDHKTAVKKYIKAANKGIVKIMSKMGISTIQSYRGAQIFEAVGLNRAFVDKYFTWTATRIQGIGIDEVAVETLRRHRGAFEERPSRELDLDWGGRYQWRREGEKHLFNPDTVHKLQNAVRNGNYKAFKDYSKDVNDQSKSLATLRGLFRFKKGNPIPLDQVEPVSEIVKRFVTGAMSYGSISKEAHQNLSIAMNRLGGKSNTGEGGEDEDRYTPDANGDSRNSAIKQVASGRFGVTSHYMVNAKELQIKMAQGAKPGEGGQLPGKKVYPWIAKTRFATPFVGLISPPPHHDIYSIEDLAQLIHDLKNANKYARVSVKLVSEVGVGTVAAGVCKAHADHVLISGHDGGTGASPLTSIKHAGIPWEMGLAETHQILVKNRLRDRIVVQADGQLKTGRDVAIACLLGAEEFGFATAALVAEGCIMMRVCHLDTCPVGIATQNPELRKKFPGKPEHVVNFMTYIAEETREIMAELGFKSIVEMVGHSELLEMADATHFWKAKGLDFSAIFAKPEESNLGPVYCVQKQDHGLDKALDNEVLIERCMPALNDKKSVKFETPIRNINRTVGTMLGAEISRKHGLKGLPDDTIQITFHGSAGQSFGAFLPRGVTLRLEGDANDYVGKGLCGGKIAVYPPKDIQFVPEDNIIAGNVLLYGATSGEAYFRGKTGERFGVRNSGVYAVVEGVGDHGCEYMTGGRVVVLGETGRNFAAGMSGGVAYVWNKAGDFEVRCNKEMVELEGLDGDDVKLIQDMLRKHQEFTASTVAAQVLRDWDQVMKQFVKVMPVDYKKALQAQKEASAQPASVA
jgi:glutamate synthase (ferredoxin)